MQFPLSTLFLAVLSISTSVSATASDSHNLDARAATGDWTQPVGDTPVGNPFKTPSLSDQVPKNAPYKVTWDPTTDKEGTVTILLLRGPTENVIPQYAIASKIKNSGSYEWTPASDLEVANTGYGLQLIVDATGEYQYTPQFGIAEEGSTPSGDTPAAASSSAPSLPAFFRPFQFIHAHRTTMSTSVLAGQWTPPTPVAEAEA